MHPLLLSQLKRAGLDPGTPPPDAASWTAFLNAVGRAYREADQDRYLLERSLEISSEEMRDLQSQLIEDRDRMRTVLEAFAVGLCEVNDRGLVVNASPETGDILERSAEELIGRGIDEVLVVRSGPPIGSLVAGADEFRGDVTVAVGGQERVLVCAVSPLNYGGVRTGAIVGVRDVTHRRRTEEAVRHSQRLLEGCLDAMPLHVAVLDAQGGVVAVNEAWRRFGQENGSTDPRHWVGRNYLDITRRAAAEDDLAARAAAGIHEVLAGRRDRFEMEYPCSSPDEQRWFLMRVSRFVSEDRTCAVVAHEDVTARRLAREALERSEAEASKLALVASRTDNAVIIMDGQGRIEWVNEAFTRMTEYTLAEVSGKRPGEVLFVPETDPRTASFMVSRIRAGLGFFTEVVKGSKSGRRYWAGVEVQPVFDDRGRVEKFVSIETDITARKEAERALRESNERFDLMVKGSGVGLWDARVLGGDPCDRANPVHYSPRFIELLGFEPGEFPPVLASWDDLIHPDDRERARETLRAHVAENAPYEIEHRVRTKAGEWRWFAARAQTLRDEHGRPVRISGSFVDVTERRLAEERVRASEERFRLAAQCASDLIWEWEPASGRLEWFGDVDGYLGYGPGEFPRTLAGWEDVLHPEDRGPAMAALTRHLRANTPYRLEYRIMHRDGSVRYWTDTGCPVRDAQGQAARWVGVCTDVTERRRAEDALRRSEEELRLVMDTVPALIASIDRDLRYQFHNRVFSEWFGLAPDQVNGRTVAEVLGEEAVAVLRPHLEAVLAGRVVTVDEHVPYARGGARWISGRYVPRLDDRGAVVGFFAFLTDVTAAKQAEAERLRQLQIERELDSIRHAVEGMEQVLGVVSHELRTPIASVRLMAEDLLMEDRFDAERWRRHVQRIEGVAVTMGETIESLLDAARANAGKTAWNWAEVELDAIAGDAVEVVRPLTAGKPVDLRVLVDPGCRAMRGDAGAVRRLIINLTSNAVRHTTEGRVTISVGRESDAEGLWTVFRVEDDGCGMGPDTLHRLGEPFALNAGVLGRRSASGSGLGLSICRTIAAAHGGWLSVASAPGRGTVFTARLRADLGGPILDSGPAPIRVLSASSSPREAA